MKKWLPAFAWAFFAILLLLDIGSKMAAIQWIPPMSWGSNHFPFGGIGIFEDFFGISFSLNFVINTGAAWGVFAGHSGLLFSLRAAIIFGLFLYLFIFHRGEAPKFPLLLILTGAIGNAIDYCRYGHVIDFFYFNFWGYSFPVFNLADSYITIGVFSLFLFSRFSKRVPAQ